MNSRHLRAVDLYSGIGGWSLGLNLAEIEVVKSYERSPAANFTNAANNRHPCCTINIREMSFDDLPENIDVVVGSPPCTQFSFSNRGGNGDIVDGLKDIKQFLAVVDHLKPRWWVMENVPRVADIVERELKINGALQDFRHLDIRAFVVKLEDYGVPQKRRRCLIGNIDFSILKKFENRTTQLNLESVIGSLSSDNIIDPIYKIKLQRGDLFDHEREVFLSQEEARINRSVKQFHPVYNSMPFPDPMDKPARTITATCTRVSRESIIISDPINREKLRRLSLRERSCIQGFPINYQFYGKSYGQKLQMIGNAIPPVLSYYIGLAIRGIQPDEAPSISSQIELFTPPEIRPPQTPAETPGRRYPSNRTFRFAIPRLRLKSGVRFELVNQFRGREAKWQIDFYFGTSKSIHRMVPRDEESRHILASLAAKECDVAPELGELEGFLESVDLRRLQDVWSHRGPGGTRPFDLLDYIDRYGSDLAERLSMYPAESSKILGEILQCHFAEKFSGLKGKEKLQRNAPVIVAGLLVAGIVNQRFAERVHLTQLPEERLAV